MVYIVLALVCLSGVAFLFWELMTSDMVAADRLRARGADVRDDPGSVANFDIGTRTTRE